MRSRKLQSPIHLIPPLAALIGLGCMLSSQFQAMILLCGFLLAAGLFCWIVHRLLRRSPSTITKAEPKQTVKSISQQLHSIDWYQFEKLVGAIFRSQGYMVELKGGANPDRGVDLVIEKDGVRSIVQCKQWRNQEVDVKTMREFLGALADHKIRNGVFVTLAGYTEPAVDLARKHEIELWNEVDLVKLIGVPSPEIKSILEDDRKLCPKCERLMVVRTARKGHSAGHQFWGCSGFPRCKFVSKI